MQQQGSLKERAAGARALLRQAARFGMVGIMNTLVGLSMIYLLRWGVGLSPLAANAGGYAVGLLVSFLLNRRWTFEFNRESGAFIRYIVAFLVCYGLNIIVLMTAIGPLKINENLAQLIAIVTYSICFFVLCRVYVFRVPNSAKFQQVTRNG